MGWDTHARPIPIKGRPSRSRKKKKEGAACHLRMHTHIQKKSLVDTSDRSRGELGRGEDFSKILFLDYHQTKTLINNAENVFLSKSLSTRLGTNRAKDKLALVTHTTRALSACASKLLYPQNGGESGELVRGRFTAYGGLQGLSLYAHTQE